jgi:hypothetical protein
MATLIQVESKEKNCSVIVNLDHVMEIAPLSAGGCAIRFIADGGKNVREIFVSNAYTEFKQFVLETVTSEHISKKVEELAKLQKKLGPKEPVALKTGDDVPAFGG